MSRFQLIAASALGLIAVAAPALAQSSTIRIEPRPYYGASITLEQGVRVWRPLPTTKYVIINPDHRTPLNLSLADVHENRTSTTIAPDATAGQLGAIDGDYDGYGYGPGYYGGRFLQGRGHRNRFGHRAIRPTAHPVAHRGGRGGHR